MCLRWFIQCFPNSFRTKDVVQHNLETPLRQCLKTADLTFIGIGLILSGVYIMAGVVTINSAGPATFLAFFIAGLVALLNGCCYSELACRIPRAGSAYSYIYVVVGELPAFVTGWSIILEYVISAAATARSLSGNIDSISLGAVSNFTISYIGRFTNLIGNDIYPDILAFALVLFMVILNMAGAKEGARFNILISATTLIFLISTTCIFFLFPFSSQENLTSSFTINNKSYNNETENWFDPIDKGGFLPFSVVGLFSGSATAFYAYIGFDALTLCSEETIDPKHSIPRAIFASIIITTVIMMLASGGLVYFIPWWTVSETSPFVSSMTQRKILWGELIAAIGVIVANTACLFVNLLAIPRIVYAMSLDGLLWPCLAWVCPYTQVPIIGLLIFGLMAGVLSLCFSLKTLAEFVSVGSLIAYSLVAWTVIILRFKPGNDNEDTLSVDEVKKIKLDETNNECTEHRVSLVARLWKHYPSDIIAIALTLFVIFSILLWISLFHVNNFWITLGSTIIISIGIATCLIALCLLKQNEIENTFKVPLVPLLPCLAIMFNLLFIMSLPWQSWIRFFGWVFVGLIIYFSYGMNHSKLNEIKSLEFVHQYDSESKSINSTNMEKIKTEYEELKH